jgi:hypothetical protein
MSAAEGKMTSETVAAASGAFAAGHGLVIGIDDYVSPGIPPLPVSVRNDALAIAKVLHDPLRCAYPETQVRQLLGREATRSALRAELEHLGKVTTEKSTVFVYFSGHGGWLPNGEYLLPADTDGASPQRVAETAISAKEFSEAISNIPAQRVLIVLDCCHAGGVATLKGATIQPGLRDELYGRLHTGHGRAVLAACAADEKAVVLRDTDPNSLFTTHLLEGLRGKAASDDGTVKVFGLFEYVQLRVTSAYSRQHPVFKADLQNNFAIALNLAQEKGIVAREPNAVYRYDACIAHADEDFDWVADHLLPALAHEGLRHTVSGDALGQFRVISVQDAVKKSKYVLAVISPHYTKDRVAQLTGILGMTQGLQQGVGKVIPVKIGEPPKEVGLALEALVGVDLTKSAQRTKAEMTKLLRQLHEDPQTW